MRAIRFTLSLSLAGFFCLATSGQVLNSMDTAMTALQRGLYFADLYNWHASRPYFVEAERLFELAGDKRNVLYAHLGALRAGIYPRSITEISDNLAQELGSNPFLQEDQELRMFCLIVKGDFDGEIDVPAMRRDWTEVEDLATKLRNQKWQYRALGQLGFADFYDGDIGSAQRKVGGALIAAMNAKDVGAQIFYLSATANGFLSQQMNDQATLYAQQAIAIAAANPDAGYPLLAQHVKLLAMIQGGKTEGARTELASLLARASAKNDPYQSADLYSTASLICRAQKDIPCAIHNLNEALQFAQIGYGNPTSQIQSDLSELYRTSGDLPKAEEFARRSAESAQSAGNIPRIPQALHALAQVQISEHKFIEADQTYDRAAMIQDLMIGNADSTLGKTALIKSASDLYAKHFSLLAEQIGNTEKAFAVVEQVRGRVMTDLLVDGATTSRQSIDAGKNIARLRLRLMAAHSDKDIRELRNQIFLAEQSSLIAPEISILKTNIHRNVTLKALEGSLTPSEVVLEYVLDDPASYCLVITREGAKIVKLAGKGRISALVNSFLAAVKSKASAQDEGRRLYETLLEPIKAINNKVQLLIIPDGQLHLVPFDGLSDTEGHFLVESRTIMYLPSATSFYLLRAKSQRSTAAATILAVGGVPYSESNLKESAVTRGYSGTILPNLPGSRDEAIAAADTFEKNSRTLLLGDKATESAFKKSINRAVIHLAVHAIANETRPDRAALVLLSDPANGEDGFLQPAEIVQLPVKANLVVLSACDTAVGPLEGEEGIATLSRAFQLAGARTVVSTLWSVEDESTLFLMKAFYTELKQNRQVSDALAMAKRRMIKNFGARAVPYYWAGFIVEGVPQSRVQQ